MGFVCADRHTDRIIVKADKWHWYDLDRLKSEETTIFSIPLINDFCPQLVELILITLLLSSHKFGSMEMSIQGSFDACAAKASL